MAGKHARLSPSAATIWLNCPGSILLCKDLPDKTGIYASEGSAAHELAENCLSKGESPFERIGEQLVADKIVFDITEEMAHGVNVYLDAVRSKAEEASQPIQIEQKVSLEYLTKTKDLGGTVDALFADIVLENTLYVYDFKYGKGIVVEVIHNPQLMIYALGALGKYLNKDGRTPIDFIEMGIVQPRAPHADGPVRTYTMAVEDLLEWADNTLLPAVTATYELDPSFCSGDHCRWCKAKRESCCPILNQSIYALAEQTFPDIIEEKLPAPAEMDLETLAKVMEGGSIIKSWYESVLEHAHERAVSGDKIPGRKLIKQEGNRVWIAPETVEKTMSKKYPTIMSAPSAPQLKSVAQVEKVLGADYKLKKDNIAELIGHMWEKPDKGLKLVEDSHKSPEYVPKTELSTAFDVVLEESEDFLN